MLEKLNRIITTPAENLGKVARFFVFQIRVWPQCIKLLKKNRAGQQAAALSYYSIFGLIPIAIVMLLIFQSFPAYQELGEKFRDYLYDYVQLSDIQYPDPSNPEVVIRATDHIDKLAKGFFAESGRGSITIFSVIVIIYAALGFLTTIERTFNNIWHVSRGRGFVQRMVNYWALTLVPLLAVGGIYLSSKIAEFCKLDGLSSIGFLRPVQSYIIAVAAFCLLYMLMPNTRVKFKSAIWGAAIAALAWSIAKWFFSAYVTKFIPYSQVYGIMGLVPLTIFWINVTWWIVLFGLQLTFTMQHLKTLEATESAASEETENNFLANDLTVINIMSLVGAAFDKQKKCLSSNDVCGMLGLPGRFGERVLDHLVSENLLMKVSDPSAGYVPATKTEGILLSDIYGAIAQGSFGIEGVQLPDKLKRIDESNRRRLSAITLKDVIESGVELWEDAALEPVDDLETKDTQ